MIIGFLGASLLICGFIIFLTFVKTNVDWKPALIMICIGIGLSMLDPIILIPIGKFIVSLPWVGGFP